MLPRDLAETYAVILFYRGSWCPYCCAQLAAFSRAQETFAAAGIRTIALSVDDKATSETLVAKLRLSFPVGFGANADDIAAVTVLYLAEGSAYLQSTGFVLDRQGRISHRGVFQRSDRSVGSRRCGRVREIRRVPARRASGASDAGAMTSTSQAELRARWLLVLLVVIWGVSWPVVKIGVTT